MSDKHESILLAQEILYKTVLPGKNELVGSLSYLVSLEQYKISGLTDKSISSLNKIKKVT